MNTSRDPRDHSERKPDSTMLCEKKHTRHSSETHPSEDSRVSTEELSEFQQSLIQTKT